MTSFRLLTFDPRRKTCRALIEAERHDGYIHAQWESRQQVDFHLTSHPNDPELLKALEHYKSGEAYPKGRTK